MNDREAAAGRGAAFARLVEVVERLRGPDGCPWDRQQTHDSLKPYLLEETYEVLAALDDAVGKPHKLREELGDLLLQILLHSVIAGERGAFTVTDVVEGLRDKLIRRHPHVFGDVEVSSVDEVNRRWQAIKAQEREESDDGQGSSLLEGVAEGLPPMARAYALQQQAAKVGFDWHEPQAALVKVQEEVAELGTALARGDAAEIAEEAGDVLFALINVIRLAGSHPEAVLASANEKFAHRFRAIEAAARATGRCLEELTLAEMDELWNQVKGAKNTGNP